MANGGSANIANSNKFNKYEDTDSGTGSSSSEAHVIRHIDRNILACQICQHRYKEPKVFKCSEVQNKRACTISKSFHELQKIIEIINVFAQKLDLKIIINAERNKSH